MSVELDVKYSIEPIRYYDRYEVSILAYDDWLNRCFDWEVYSFSSKPTKRQIRKCKSKFYNRINGRGL